MKKILMYGFVFLIFIAGAFAVDFQVDDFEDNDISDWTTGSGATWASSSLAPFNGSYHLRWDADASTGYEELYYNSSFTDAWETGDELEVAFQKTAGVADHQIRFWGSNGNYLQFKMFGTSAIRYQCTGGSDTTIVSEDPRGNWYRGVFTYQGSNTWDAEVFYANGTSAGSATGISCNLGSYFDAVSVFPYDHTDTSSLYVDDISIPEEVAAASTESIEIPTVVDFRSNSSIVISGSTYQTVYAGEFTPEYNSTAFTRTKIKIENTVQSKTGMCRVTIDGTDYNTEKSRSFSSREIGNIYLHSGEFNVVANQTYQYVLECNETGSGSMTVLFDENIVNLLYNGSGYAMNTTYLNDTYILNSSSYTLLSNVSFTTPSGAITNNYTLYYEGSLGYSYTSDATHYIYTVINGFQSAEFVRGGASGTSGSGSFFTYVDNLTENTTYQVELWGKSTSSDGSITVKSTLSEYSQRSSEINNTNLSGLSTSSTSWTNLTSIIVNNTGRTNEEILVSSSINFNGTTTDSAFFRIRSGNIYSDAIESTQSSYVKSSTILSVLDELGAGSHTITLQGKVDGGTVSLKGGTLSAKGIIYSTFESLDFNISAVNAFNGSTIPIFNVTLDSGTVFFANGSDAQLFANGTLLNFTVSADGYLNKTFINVNTSTDFTAQMAQAYASFNAFELITNNSVTGSVLVNGTYNDTGNLFPLNVGNYTVTFNASGYFDKSTTVEILSLTNTSYNIYNVGNAQVNVSFYTNFTNASATNVTGYIYNDTYGFNESFDSSPNASYIFDIVQNITFTVVIDSPLYSLQNFTILTNNTYKNQSEYLYTFNSVLITFLDQDTLNSLNGTNVTIELISDVQSTLNYTTTGEFYVDLLSPSSYTVRYTADGYAESFYYFELSNQSDIQLTLYLINESAVTNVTFIVLDEINTLLEDAVIKVHKYNPSLGAYTIVEILLTNFEGEAVAPIELGAEFYYFIVEYPSGTIVKTTSPSYIYDTTVQIPVVLSAPLAQNFFQTNNVATSLVFNNATDNFKYTFSDSANLLEGACLYVYRISTFDKTLYNSSCVTGASGQILINVANTTGVTYLAQGEIELTDETKIITDSLWKNFGAIRAFGTLGIFATIIILITLVLLGIWNPSVSIILTTFALALAKVIGFLSIGWEYIIGLIVLGVLLVIVISKKS